MKFKELLEVMDPNAEVKAVVRINEIAFSCVKDAKIWLDKKYCAFHDLEISRIAPANDWILAALKGDTEL